MKNEKWMLYYNTTMDIDRYLKIQKKHIFLLFVISRLKKMTIYLLIIQYERNIEILNNEKKKKMPYKNKHIFEMTIFMRQNNKAMQYLINYIFYLLILSSQANVENLKRI